MDRTTRKSLRTGNEMPVLGLGTWMLTNNTAETIAAALEMGYAMIDTSGDYGTQPGIGEGIRMIGVDRANLYLVTKVEETDDAYQATRKNLEELGLDYVDLMLIHRPPPSGAGEQLWEGLMRAKEEGITRDIGVSNYSAQLVDDLVDATGEMPAVNQIEWSPFGHSMELKRHHDDNQIVLQAYSPLTRARRLDDPALSELAQEIGGTPAQLMLRWNLQHGTVPLPKANRRDHLQENLGTFDLTLDDEAMARLDRLNSHYSSLGQLPYV